MSQNARSALVFFAVVILTLVSLSSFACTCIGKDRQSTETELNNIDLAVTGKVISVANFDYYDTVGYSFSGLKFDPKQSGYLIRKYKVFTIVIEKKFKAAKNLSDTIQVVTGNGGGDCGYEFELGRDYIVYADTWKEKVITTRHRKHKIKRKLAEIVIADKFYTDICRLTQETNAKELDSLKRLTE